MPLGPIPITQARVAAVYDPNGQITDAGIAAVISSATVGTAIAGIPAGAVGSTAFSRAGTSGAGYAYGSIEAGSAIHPIGLNWDGNTPSTLVTGGWRAAALSGTWMCIGQCASTASHYQINNWLRIA